MKIRSFTISLLVLALFSASLTFLPSEDVSARPEYLRRKMERGEAAREEEERDV